MTLCIHVVISIYILFLVSVSSMFIPSKYIFLTVVRPAVQLLQIQKCIRCHIPVHAIFAVFYLFFLPILSRPSFTSRTPNKTRRQSNSSTFFSFKSYNPETFMSSAVTAFVHATRKRSQKVPRAKSGTFWFPWMDSHVSSTIQ